MTKFLNKLFTSPWGRKGGVVLFSFFAYTASVSAQNPYLPLWEHIPDGEPYVFEDPDKPGEYRVYIYGSHDNIITDYCGRDQVVWSVSVNDLNNWRYDGIIFKSEIGPDGRPLKAGGIADVLFAPDVTMKIGKDGKKEYYLYPNNQEWGRNGMAAKSDRPDGPFVVCNWSKTNPTETDGVLKFDPAVFVDDDGRVYGYWGFEKSYAAEFDPETMATVKPGTQIIEDMVSSSKQPGDFRFFEASSMRKIQDKYVFIYSRITAPGEFGLPSDNYTLAYAYSDNPLGPWTYGGTLIDGRGRDTDANGKTITTAVPYGNTHGSLCEINGKWWIFYHRQIGTNEYSRQAMVAPVTVKVEKGKGGKVTISEGEYNSEGFMTEGLNPLHRSAAAWACYLLNPKGVKHEYPNNYYTGSYIEATRVTPEEGWISNQKNPICPIINNTSGSIVGYKYFNLNHTTKKDALTLVARLTPEGIDGTIDIMIDSPDAQRGGKKIGQISISKDAPKTMAEYSSPIDGLKGMKGKHALYFVFKSSVEDKSICKLYDFIFK